VVAQDPRGHHREIPGERFDLIASADRLDFLEIRLRLLTLLLDFPFAIVGRN
jgi:hypothetical protein